jgi:hypothetical protein
MDMKVVSISIRALIIMGLLISGCATKLTQGEYIILPNRELPKCPANKALVYFLYTDKWASTKWVPIVLRNNEIIGALSGGTYFYDIVDPGKYVYRVDQGSLDSSMDRVQLIVKPGKTYYIRYSSADYRLDLTSEDVALNFLNALEYIQVDPTVLKRLNSERNENGTIK